MTPHVSVVVATRNRRRTLERALASVDGQRYRSFEVIVVDDASTDGTSEWLREARRLDRLVVGLACAGAAAARNRGLEQARGQIIAFLDDDDVWMPTYLETQVASLDADPSIALSTTGHVEVDPRGRRSHPDLRPLVDRGDALLGMLAACPIHTLSVVACRRAEFARIGGFDETLEIVHDLDWYLRLLAAGGRLAHTPAVLVERAVPGGLVTRHHQWFAEERAVHRGVFARQSVPAVMRRRIHVSRSLFFARVGLLRGDPRFAIRRLVEALTASPLDAAWIGVSWLRRKASGGVVNSLPFGMMARP